MNTLFVAIFVALAVSCSAGVVGHGAIVSGPSGIVTGAGPIGPHGLGLGYGHGLGYGGYGHGLGLGYAGHGALVAGPAVVAAPAVAVAAHGYGLGLGHGGVITNGGGYVGYSGHGVAVKGPATVPVSISGPAGKIVADGLYGVPTHHGHYW